MADSSIGALPQAPQVDDESLLVMEQQGQAVKLTGAQLKEYAKRGVELQFKEDLAQSQAAADRAAEAASAVTGMTVEAHPSDTATVTKTTKNGKVNLSFGLPRGERGEPGPEGTVGPRGPRGETGRGLTILGHYDTESELRAAVTAPEAGDSYSVGLERPYDIYILDGVTMDWRNYGPLSGGGGGTVLPENVVTTPGGAEMVFTNGDGPHTLAFDFEEEEPLTAEDIAYGETTVGEAMEKLFTSVSDGKALIASAITDKGVKTAQDAAFSEMAANIGRIATGSNTGDATATPGDILAGKTAYTAAGKVEGLIPTLAARAYTPGTAAQTIANGQYLGGTQTIQGDPNLTSGNIKKGVSIFGVAGAVEQSFLATLTVTADVGAVVTATHAGGTEVEALSTTGTVVLELPIEGKWTVTARRGVAQYNSVVVEVTSQYSAALTAEVHIVYFGTAERLSAARSALSAASVGDYVLFAGGYARNENLSYPHPIAKGEVDIYDKFLSKQTKSIYLNPYRYNGAASAVGGYALFCGGSNYVYSSGSYIRTCYDTAEAISDALVKKSITPLNQKKGELAAAAIGDFALFAGGLSDQNTSVSTVDAYDGSLTKTEPTVLAIQSSELAAASNEKYAIFGGGANGSEKNAHTTAYNSTLTRTLPARLSAARSKLAAAAAGNYILFAGGDGGGSVVDAYDLFLTRTTAEAPKEAKADAVGTSLRGYALFAGDSAPVEIYDAYLVRTTASKEITDGLQEPAAVSIDSFALIGGGRTLASDGRHQSQRSDVFVFQYV